MVSDVREFFDEVRDYKDNVTTFEELANANQRRRLDYLQAAERASSLTGEEAEELAMSREDINADIEFLNEVRGDLYKQFESLIEQADDLRAKGVIE